jgi:hypothetical protein
MVAPTSAVTRRRLCLMLGWPRSRRAVCWRRPRAPFGVRGPPPIDRARVRRWHRWADAARELSERGFDVTVYERRAWGGKARSTDVVSSAAGRRRPLPEEHGFRVFFGFYVNNPDTFRRIPFGSSPNGVFDDDLTAVPQLSFARDRNARSSSRPTLGSPRAYTPALIHETLLAAAFSCTCPPMRRRTSPIASLCTCRAATPIESGHRVPSLARRCPPSPVPLPSPGLPLLAAARAGARHDRRR